MALNLNKVILAGRLTANPEPRQVCLFAHSGWR